MIKQLMTGDLNRDLKAFDQVIGMLEELAYAWKNMPPIQVAQQQPANQSAEITGGQQKVVNFKQKEHPAQQETRSEKRVSV